MGLFSSSRTSPPRVEPSILRELHRSRRRLTHARAATLTALILLVVVLLASSIADAAEPKTFTWSNPTQYEDGSPLDPADLVSYELGCTSLNDQTYTVIESWPTADPLPTSRDVVATHRCTRFHGTGLSEMSLRPHNSADGCVPPRTGGRCAAPCRPGRRR